MLKRYIIRLFWSPALFFLDLSLLLIGCDTSGTGIGQTTATPTTQELDGTPKGPGAANLTATALATPIATVCPTFSAAPGSFNDSSADGSHAYYEAAVLPGTSTFPFENVSGAPEHFEVSVTLTGPVFNPASDPTWKAETSPITISETKTILYDRTSPDCGETDRIAVANFGQYHFTFYMGVYAPGKVQQDISLFLGIVHSFVYSG